LLARGLEVGLRGLGRLAEGIELAGGDGSLSEETLPSGVVALRFNDGGLSLGDLGASGFDLLRTRSGFKVGQGSTRSRNGSGSGVIAGFGFFDFLRP
jgi:hypothetical protein